MRGARGVATFLCAVSSGGGCLLTTSLSGLAGGPAVDVNDAAPANEAGANDAGGNDAAKLEGGAAGYAAAILADAPILYWRLGEKDTTGAARDASKSGRDGAFLGSVQCGVEGAIRGDTDTACRFDGTTSAVSVGAAGLVFANNVSYSIEAWARPATVTANHPVFSIAGHDVEKDGYILLIDSSARFVNIRETSDGLVGATGPAGMLGAYEHVVGVYDNEALLLYVNGNLVATSAAKSPVPGLSNIPFSVGADGLGHGQPFVGDIDEVAIYDHALSADQVSIHYQAANREH